MKTTSRQFRIFGRSNMRPILIAALLAALALGAGWPLPAFADGHIVVNSTADTTVAGDSQCTLREAILNSNTFSDTTNGDCATGDGIDTITFSVTGTIVLGSTLPDIVDNVTISGPGAAQLTISGNHSVGVLSVPSAALSLDHLTVANGSAYAGGAISSQGSLRISNTTFTGNSASYGGAISNQGG